LQQLKTLIAEEVSADLPLLLLRFCRAYPSLSSPSRQISVGTDAYTQTTAAEGKQQQEEAEGNHSIQHAILSSLFPSSD
jgi:hypothetical protein